MVCFRNICVNTLHKGDSIFTYNNNSNNNNSNNMYTSAEKILVRDFTLKKKKEPGRYIK
jgi:hypothetical protein